MKNLLYILTFCCAVAISSCKEKEEEQIPQENVITCTLNGIKDGASDLSFERDDQGRIVKGIGYSLRAITLEQSVFPQTYRFTYTPDGKLDSIYGAEVELAFYSTDIDKPDSASMLVLAGGVTILIYFTWEGENLTEVLWTLDNGKPEVRQNFNYTEGNVTSTTFWSYDVNNDTWNELYSLDNILHDDAENFATDDLALKMLFFDPISFGKNNVSSYRINSNGMPVSMVADIEYNEQGEMTKWTVSEEDDPLSVPLNQVEISYDCK